MKKSEVFFVKSKFLRIIIVLCISGLSVICIRKIVQQVQYQSYLKQAKASEEKEQYIDAVIYYAMASHMKPKKEKPYLKMADCYIERSEFNQANVILTIGMSNIEKQNEISLKQEKIQSFVDKDVNTEKVAIPEYTRTSNIKGKAKIEALIKEMRSYNGINGAFNEQSAYYKGFYYFIEDNVIYRTKNSVEAKEKVYGSNDKNNINSLKIANDRIFFSYELQACKLASIKIDGSDYISYKECMFDMFTIYKGWIYYHDIVEPWLYNDKYKENIGISKIDFSGKKNELVSKYKKDRGFGYLNNRYVYYIVNSNRILKGNLHNNKKKEEIVLELSNSIEKTIISNVWGYKDTVIYKTEGEGGKFMGYYVYDAKLHKQTKMYITESSYIHNIKDNWIYYTVETDNEEKYKNELYRKNIKNGEKEKIGEVQCSTSLDISNNKVIVQDENEKGDTEVKFVDVENTEIN